MLKQFGQIDGVPVFEATLTNAAGAEAKVISWGAALR
ncbi:MAG: galactose mutarotase, partial [Methylobacteriaceae bacterium]|nr:galactose mutarotase [Methylobacteriaceae bacterium]